MPTRVRLVLPSTPHTLPPLSTHLRRCRIRIVGAPTVALSPPPNDALKSTFLLCIFLRCRPAAGELFGAIASD